jgi:hypothetical protein
VRIDGQHTARNRFHGDAPDVLDKLAHGFSGQLTAADLLPNRVRGFREEESRRNVIVWECE